MNKMNGGYVMVRHDASQDELKSAYESFKPVIYYDATGRALYATITESGGTYSIETLSGAIDDLKAKKLYNHFITIYDSSSNVQASLLLTNNSNEPYTFDTLNTHVKALTNDAGSPYGLSASGVYNSKMIVNLRYTSDTKFTVFTYDYSTEDARKSSTTITDTIVEA